jgi:hypothetical protein
MIERGQIVPTATLVSHCLATPIFEEQYAARLGLAIKQRNGALKMLRKAGIKPEGAEEEVA